MNIFEEFRKRGYAPGNYMNKCSKCGEVFVGDKKAWTCFSCVAEQVGNVAKPNASSQLYEGWRDTSKELPETRDDVIICNKINQCVSVGWYNSEHNLGEGKWLIRTANFDGDVELWQPLPSPPAFV